MNKGYTYIYIYNVKFALYLKYFRQYLESYRSEMFKLFLPTAPLCFHNIFPSSTTPLGAMTLSLNTFAVDDIL